MAAFNNRMQSSLDRLNLGPRLARNNLSPSEKKTNKENANKKADNKLYNWYVLKDIEWPDQLSTKRKENCKLAYL